MLRIAVTGAAGKMGITVIKVIEGDKELKLAGALEAADSQYIGMDAGIFAGIGNIGIAITGNPEIYATECDAIIDFSSPKASEKNIEIAVNNKIALVIGTTGLDDKVMNLIREAGKLIPVIWSPNYSIGVNLIAKLTRLAAEILDEGFDVEIVEAHHRLKKDAPSGTAIKLLNILKEVYHTNDVIYGREGITGERPGKQIGMSAIRGGDIVGDHTVNFLGIGERIEITHKLTSRETLARGAVKAAKYIVKNGKGLYKIEDVLGLN